MAGTILEHLPQMDEEDQLIFSTIGVPMKKGQIVLESAFKIQGKIQDKFDTSLYQRTDRRTDACSRSSYES